MPKPIIQNLVQQAKQIAEESFEQVKKQTGSILDVAGEQIVVKSSLDGAKTALQSPSENPTVQKMEAQDRIRRVNRMTYLRQQLEQEVKRCQMAREQQLKQRREQTPQLQQQEEEKKKQQATQPPEIATKRKQGLFGIWGKRVKTAQQQAQPEMAGKRTGG